MRHDWCAGGKFENKLAAQCPERCDNNQLWLACLPSSPSNEAATVQLSMHVMPEMILIQCSIINSKRAG